MSPPSTRLIRLGAIEDFRSQKGTYPKFLRELVPVDVSNIPATKMGFGDMPFFYSTRDGMFVLSFNCPGWADCMFDSQSKSWVLD